MATDSITSEVSKKVNDADIGTKIQQNVESVRIAWNNISKYIQFEDGELRIYDSNVIAQQKLVARFNYNGSSFYREGKHVGNIGTSNWVNDTNYRGLVFQLSNEASYMAWSVYDASTGTYKVQLVHHMTNTKGKKGFEFQDDVYAGGRLYLTDNNRFIKYSDGDAGYNGYMCFVDSSHTIGVRVSRSMFRIEKYVSVNFYSDLNMHGYSISNQSDARLKKNIAPTRIKALEVLNALDMKEFDWIEDDLHEPIGIIAQQLQKVAPELIQYEEEGYLGIKMTKLIPYLIKAIQELSGEGYEKAEWIDKHTLEEKIAFVERLERKKKEHSEADEMVNPVIELPKA